MKLGAIIQDLDANADDLCIVARRPWSPDADALIVPFTDEFRISAEVLESGYRYFLGIAELKNDILGEWGRVMSDKERIELAIHYAENDAWPSWFYDDVQQRPLGDA